VKDPKNLDIKAVARKLRWPTKDWHGQCYAVACAIVKAGIVKGRAVYGHYLGPVAETGHWAERRGQAFQRHGWIVLEDGRILDPTRWSFEDDEPNFFLFDPADTDAIPCAACPHRADEHTGGTFILPCGVPGCGCGDFNPKSEYDEGGNGFRALTMRPMPAYREPGPKADKYEKNHLKHMDLKLPKSTRAFLLGLLKNPPAITWEMVHWIANLNPGQFGPHTKEIFQSIVDAGESVLIPVDNRIMVLGE
jgi:hypothetical protein